MKTITEIYRSNDEQAMLSVVKSRIEDDTIKWAGACVADNYGTEGEVRYQQRANIDGVTVVVYWDTTAEHDKWCADCLRIEYLLCEDSQRELDEDEQKELDILLADDPRDNAYYTDDESNACDWDSPVAVEMI